MKRRSYALLGALALVVAAAVVLAVVLPRRARPAVAQAAPTIESPAPATAQSKPAEPGPAPAAPKPPETAPTTAAPKPVTPEPSSATTPETAPPVKPAAPAEPTAAPQGPEAAAAPFIRVDSPREGALYHSSVFLSGRITDAEKSGSASRVESAQWAITGTGKTGRIDLESDGSFRLSVPTDGLRGAQSLVVKAARKGGTAAEIAISLSEDSAGPAVSFTTRPDQTYGSSVSVAGRVAGPPAASDPLSEIGAVTWGVDGTSLGGPLQLTPGGAFSVSFSTIGMRGSLTVTVHATDKNGHAAEASLSLADKTGGPSIRIESPSDKSEYGASVTVDGTVGDPKDPSGSSAEVKSLTWRVIGQEKLGGDVPFQKNGSFRFGFPTEGISGPLVLELVATDRNDRTRSQALTLLPASSAAAAAGKGPSLAITSPSDDVPLGTSITVAGTAAGTEADPLDSVAWAIAGSKLRGTVDVGANGGFSFSARTAGLNGTQVLTVTATSVAGLATSKVIVLRDTATGLPIVLASPQNGGYYRDITVFDGRVGDAGSAGDLKSFSYEVLGVTGVGGRVAPQPDGKFKFVFSSSTLTGDITVRLAAEDARGRKTQSTIVLHDGKLKPSVAVSAPTQGSPYGNLIRVAGSVKDPFEGRPGIGGIDSLSWLVSPVDFSRSSTPARGTAKLDANGQFRFSIPTTALAGPQDLTLTALGKSGNRGEVTVRIMQGDGDIPGFTVKPSDGKVTITWSQAPFAERYDLVWGPGVNGLETGRTMTGVSSPLTLSGLQNGALYTLKAQVRFDDGGTGASPVTKVIPLAPQTLAPTVRGDYQQIVVSWPGIPGADSFEVWRSSNAVKSFEKVAPAVKATQYVDSAVEFGREYAYQIAPAGALAPMSASASAKSLAFPVEKLAHLGEVTMAAPRRVTVNGGYAFIASGSGGVRVVDISTAKTPTEIGTIPSGDAWGVAVSGDYTYVAAGEDGLVSVDMSEPRSPVVIGTRKTADARAVIVSGSTAFVADGTKGLKVIDVSDAQALNRIGTEDTTNALGLALSGTRLFLADGEGGLKVYDVSKPSRLRLMGSLALKDARGIAVEGRIAAVADGADGLKVVDISDPSKPVLLSSFDTGAAVSVSLNAGFAYVADGSAGIKVVDVSTPSKPKLFTSHGAPGAIDVSVVDDTAYILDTAGLEVMRVQIQGRSFKVASAETKGKAYSVTVAGNLAYVAAHAGGLQIVNVGDVTRINDSSLVASFPTRFATSVAVQADLAYIADGTNGLHIVDVSAAQSGAKGATPKEIGTYRPGGTVSAVVVVGTTAYVAAGEQGVAVLDVSKPAFPQEIASVQTKHAYDVLSHGNWLFVADGDGGLRVLDCADPAKPVALPVVYKENAKALALTGSLLVVSGDKSVGIVDVTNPDAPVVRGTYETEAAEAVAANGTYAYIAEGYRGLTVLDISSPQDPVVVSACDEVFAVGVAMKGSYAIVVDSFGMRVIQILIPDWLMR